MASDVDICNLALSHLGDQATVAAIDPSDGSQQADLCVRFYPIARDQVLSMHAWSFATKRVALALIDTDELPDSWLYCYALPASALTVIAVLPAESTSDVTDPADYVQEVLQDGTKVIFTNTEDATARYVWGVTDTTKFTALFTPAVARLLASYLAGPLLKGETGAKVAKEHFMSFLKVELPWATSMDQKGQRINAYKTFTPDGITARQ